MADTVSKSEMRRLTATRSPGVLYDDLVKMLRSLEWADHSDHGWKRCPVCSWADSHRDNCALAALLRELP